MLTVIEKKNIIWILTTTPHLTHSDAKIKKSSTYMQKFGSLPSSPPPLSTHTRRDKEQIHSYASLQR